MGWKEGENWFLNDCIMLKKTIAILFIISFCFIGKSQGFEFHPSLALSSGLGFSSNMANETSIMLRSEFTIKNNNIGDFCPIIGIGYTGRTYSLKYHSPGIDSFSEPVFMHSPVLEVSILMRLTSWRKLRRRMIPYIGINSFRFLSKSISKEEKAFFDQVDPSYSESISNYRSPHTYFSIETGVELVRSRWPRLCLSILWELPIPTEFGLGDPTGKVYFRHASMFCPRLVIGLRL